VSTVLFFSVLFFRPKILGNKQIDEKENKKSMNIPVTLFMIIFVAHVEEI